MSVYRVRSVIAASVRHLIFYDVNYTFNGILHWSKPR